MSAADLLYLRLFKFYRPNGRLMQKNIAAGIDMEVDWCIGVTKISIISCRTYVTLLILTALTMNDKDEEKEVYYEKFWSIIWKPTSRQ